MFTDPQPESDVEVDFIREDVIEALAGTKARFGITSGDIMFDDLSLYDRYNAIIGTIGLPWWNIGGNHDLNFEAPHRRRSRETFKRVFGPNYYAFCYSQTLFLMLDDVDYLGADKTKANSAGSYEGRLDATQLEFVRNVLAHTPADTLIVMVLHIPLRTYMNPPAPASFNASSATSPATASTTISPNAAASANDLTAATLCFAAQSVSLAGSRVPSATS